MLLAILTISSDFSGSEVILVSMNAHLAHSKVRFSVPSERGAMLVKSIRVLHRAQRGRSIGDNSTSVREFMALPSSLSPGTSRTEKISRLPSLCLSGTGLDKS